RQRLLVGLQTLDYLQRGGRIGRARAFLGGLLNIKPLLTLQDGEVAPSERVRSRSRMLARLGEFALSYADPEMVSIVHAACPADAQALEALVRAAFPRTRVACGWIGPVVGLYTGPGALGVAIVPGEAA
ncbi:MAG TPA: DegV family protein, partial [Dehalococcoidia bacterium]|nr:DegV family protein [Dehalococcoidia bacterium]